MSPRLLALWLKESIALLRDRHGLLALFIMPTIFILVMTMALRDAFTPGAAIDVSYVVVDLDRSVQSKALIKRLDKAASFRRQDNNSDPEAARHGILAGHQALALMLPPGFGERLLTPAGADGKPTEPLQLLIDPTLSPASTPMVPETLPANSSACRLPPAAAPRRTGPTKSAVPPSAATAASACLPRCNRTSRPG